MSKLQSKEADLLFEAILSLRDTQECYCFFEDICTIKELQSLIQRFQVACQLDAGKNYMEVYESTGVSSATISRVNKCLVYGNGGYRMALDRMNEAGRIEYESTDDSEKG